MKVVRGEERYHHPWIQWQELIVAVPVSAGWGDGFSLAPWNRVQWVQCWGGNAQMPPWGHGRCHSVWYSTVGHTVLWGESLKWVWGHLRDLWWFLAPSQTLPLIPSEGMKTPKPPCDCPPQGQVESLVWERTLPWSKALFHPTGSASYRPLPLSGSRNQLVAKQMWWVLPSSATPGQGFCRPEVSPAHSQSSPLLCWGALQSTCCFGK